MPSAQPGGGGDLPLSRFVPQQPTRSDAAGNPHPLDAAFSAFVFKVQANMDPSHRDRIAFVRMCSGKYTPGMKLKVMRTAKELRPTSGTSVCRGNTPSLARKAATAAACGTTLAALRVDGGASIMDLLLQMQADQLGVTVQRPSDRETTALGAAYLAGLAEGVWPSLDAISDRWQIDATFEPEPDRLLADLGHGEWLRAVDRSRAWIGSP